MVLACSRLRDGGGKSFSNKKCEKRAGAGERQGAPFPKSCASYFRFARFNTFPLYYLRAWHRLSWYMSHHTMFSKYVKWNGYKLSAHRFLPRVSEVGKNKYPIFLWKPKSDINHNNRLQNNTNSEVKWSPGYHTGVWMADKVMILCVKQL